MVPFADIISDNSWLLLAVLVLLVFATGYGLYTRQGSGIAKHPTQDAPQPVDAKEQSGPGAEPNDRAGIDDAPSRELSRHGTR